MSIPSQNIYVKCHICLKELPAIQVDNCIYCGYPVCYACQEMNCENTICALCYSKLPDHIEVKGYLE